MLDLEKISDATVHREWKHGTARKNLAGSAMGAKKSSPMKKLSMGDMRWDLEKNRRRQCIGVKTSGPENNPPAAGSAKTFLPRRKIVNGISHAGLRKNLGPDSVSEWEHGTARKKMTGSAIGLKKEFPDEKVLLGRYALGLRKKNRRRLPRCKHRGVVCKAIRACSPMSPMGLPPATVRWLHWHGSPRCFHSNTSPLRVFF